MGGVSATDGLQTAANLSNSSATTLGQPTLCLATIKASTTANQVGDIYDVRTYTNTSKTYATIASATQILGGVVNNTSAGLVISSTSATAGVLGVIVAGTNATGTAGTPNIIIATAGPQWVKASSGTVNDFVLPSTTSGYTTAAAATGVDAFDALGINLRSWGATCTTDTFGTTDCQASDFTNLDIE
jgi:hypothetical protein